jgi:Zn-dependent peptidase ImmA (M78 family)
MARIADLVQKLLNEHGLTKPPIPIEKLAQNLGVELRYEPFEHKGEQVSGMLFRDKGRSVIGVNSNESAVRQRFTIAHEIGHLHLHKDSVHFDTPAEVFLRNHLSSKSVDPKEIQANAFAAELLMPAKFVRAEFNQERGSALSDEDVVEKLANKFMVSSQAMTFRLANLGLMKLS